MKEKNQANYLIHVQNVILYWSKKSIKPLKYFEATENTDWQNINSETSTRHCQPVKNWLPQQAKKVCTG